MRPASSNCELISATVLPEERRITRGGRGPSSERGPQTRVASSCIHTGFVQKCLTLSSLRSSFEYQSKYAVIYANSIRSEIVSDIHYTRA